LPGSASVFIKNEYHRAIARDCAACGSLKEVFTSLASSQ
jgi:hypothetical protein